MQRFLKTKAGIGLFSISPFLLAARVKASINNQTAVLLQKTRYYPDEYWYERKVLVEYTKMFWLDRVFTEPEEFLGKHRDDNAAALN